MRKMKVEEGESVSKAKKETFTYRGIVKSQYVERFFVYIIGLFCIGLGVGSVVHSSYGQSPLETLYVTLSERLHVSLGEASWFVGIVLVVGLMVYLKSWKPAISLVTVVLLGYMIDLGKYMNDLIYVHPLFLFIVGMMLIGFGIALYIRPRLSVTPFDTVMVIIKEKVKGKVHIAKLIVDTAAVAIAIGLGGWGNIKLGMVVMILTMPFVIKFVENTFDHFHLFVYKVNVIRDEKEYSHVKPVMVKKNEVNRKPKF